MSEATRRPLRTAIYQPEAVDGSPTARLGRLDAVLAGGNGFDLVVCPELFLSGYAQPAEILIATAETSTGEEQAAGIAARHRTSILYGHPERAGDALYNAATLVGPDGDVLARYRKRRIAPGWEREVFTAGDGGPMAEIAGWRVAIRICYDIEFPEFARADARAGAEVVAAPTALGRRWPFVARKMIPTRAFENGVFLLYANHAGREGDLDYLGESVILGPAGEELARAGAAEALIAADLDPDLVTRARATLPYVDEAPTSA